MSPQSIVSPEDQSATFVELFFDLVFVFSVTQVASLLHDNITGTTVAQAVLVFWLVWWAWTQFTWALNAADTTHDLVELGTLIATAVAFFMSIALPDAFHGRALWFAVPYVLVRTIGLTLYAWVASHDPSQQAAVRIFGLVSMGGLVTALIGAALGGTWQYVLWSATILLDIMAARVGGQQEGWNLHPEHFEERHGLFIIIALGETLIAAAIGASGVEWSADLVAVAVLAVAVTCGLWWIYFKRTKPVLGHALASARGVAQTKMARDVFSLIHFPMLCGVIAYAVAVEEAVVHPSEPLPLELRLMLAASVVLFVGGALIAMWRAARRPFLLPWGIIIFTALVVIAAANVASSLSLAILFIGIIVIIAVEQRIVRPTPDTEDATL